MSYYMGDFYPRGDPGIRSFFTGLARKAAPFAGMIPVVGPTLSKTLGVIGNIMPGGAHTAAAGAITAAAGSIKTAIVKHPVLSAAGAAGALGVTMGAAGERMMAAPSVGRHQRRPLKHCGQILKSGKAGKCYRSMNVCNPRALRRAIRRTRGFAKLAMKTIHIVHPKKKGRFGGFKKRKRS